MKDAGRSETMVRHHSKILPNSSTHASRLGCFADSNHGIVELPGLVGEFAGSVLADHPGNGNRGEAPQLEVPSLSHRLLARQWIEIIEAGDLLAQLAFHCGCDD